MADGSLEMPEGGDAMRSPAVHRKRCLPERRTVFTFTPEMMEAVEAANLSDREFGALMRAVMEERCGDESKILALPAKIRAIARLLCYAVGTAEDAGKLHIEKEEAGREPSAGDGSRSRQRIRLTASTWRRAQESNQTEKEAGKLWVAVMAELFAGSAGDAPLTPSLCVAKNMLADCIADETGRIDAQVSAEDGREESSMPDLTLSC